MEEEELIQGGGSCWSASTVNPPSRDCHCSSVHCLEKKVWLQTQCSYSAM